MNESLLDTHLRGLRLPAMLANYARLAKRDPEKIAYLEELALIETEKRRENGNRSRLAAARFPTIKTIESFDFALQPKLPRHHILALFNASFVEEARNAVFIGPTGVGKTHLACALGAWSCLHGYRTSFTTAAELLMSLIAAKRDGRLKQRLKIVERHDLLIIDELGYIPFEREATDLLYHVIAGRYERGSTVITTNLAFPQWGTVFPDAMTASAVVDRIVHHASVFELSGESHRLRTRRKAPQSAAGKRGGEGSEPDGR